MIKDLKEESSQGCDPSSGALSKTTSTRSWKKLQEKYICYVGLLKTRVNQTKHKLRQQTTNFAVGSLSKTMKAITRRRKKLVLEAVKHVTGWGLTSRQEKLFPLGDLFSYHPAKSATDGTINIVSPRQVAKNLRMQRLCNFVQNRFAQIKQDAFLTIKTSGGNASAGRIKLALTNLKTSLDQQLLFEHLPKGSLRTYESTVQSIFRENCQLKLECKSLKDKLERLHRQLDISNEARESQIRKKTQSLERIALELHEKDEMLRELEKELDYYDEKERCNTGKLLTPATEAQYKMETLKLEEENERLAEQLHDKEVEFRQEIRKLKEELLRYQSQEGKLAIKQQQLESLAQAKFNLEYECRCLSRSNSELKRQLAMAQERIQSSGSMPSDMLSIMPKICAVFNDRSLSAVQKLACLESLVNSKRLWADGCRNGDEKRKTAVLSIIERILDDNEYSAIHESPSEQSDEEIRNKIESIGQKIRRLKIASQREILRSASSPDRQQSHPRAYNSEQTLFDSVLEAFPEIEAPVPDIVATKTESCQSRPPLTDNNIAGSHQQQQKHRLKLQEMVLTLKDRHLAVRNIIYQLLRSLQIKYKSMQLRKLPKQADNILSVLFNLFEYSEEERLQIFPKKQKGFWGLL